MRAARGILLAIGLVVGLGLGAPVGLSTVDAPVATAALTRFVDDAAAQPTVDCTLVLLAFCPDNSGGDSLGVGGNGGSATGGTGAPGTGGAGGLGDGGRGGNSSADAGDGGNSGRGGNGGFSSVRDVGNANANASNSVIVGDITTGDVDGHAIQVDARGATDPVVTLVAGSFGDTGVDSFAPGGNAQAGTTGGNANTADSSGGDSGDAGDGGNATSSGGNGGNGTGGAGGTSTGGQGGPATGGVGGPGTGGSGGDACSPLLLAACELVLGLG